MIKSSLKEQLYLRNRFRSGYEVWLQMPRHFQQAPNLGPLPSMCVGQRQNGTVKLTV